MDRIWSRLWLQTSIGEGCLKTYPLKQRKCPVVFQVEKDIVHWEAFI